MKKSLLLSFLLLAAIFSFSQAPGIRWQRPIGGPLVDGINFYTETIDTGILVVGITSSNVGGSQSFHGGNDILVQKLTSDGILQWQRTLGGSSNETATSYVYNADGSIVILAGTGSNNGDVTNYHGNGDLWVCKLNKSGSLLWQRTLGGSSLEFLGDIAKTADGGYIISGTTSSTDGDVTGLHGTQDGWLAKVNDAGQLVWQKCIGGSLYEGLSNVEVQVGSRIFKVIGTPDGAIYAFLTTQSNDGDVSGNHGDQDIWVVKLNSAGVIQWQKCIGGHGYDRIDDVKISGSGNFIIAGYTRSDDLPSFHANVPAPQFGDAFVCSVNTNGDLLWQKCYGSFGDDGRTNQVVSVEADGGYVLASTIDNWTDVVGHHGFTDIWVFKINSIGDIVWQTLLGGSSVDDFQGQDREDMLSVLFQSYGHGLGIKTKDNGFLITGVTRFNDGDITNYHLPPGGAFWQDIWVVKLSAGGALEWQRCMGGTRTELPQGLPFEIEPGVFIIGGNAYSKDGDLQRNYGKSDGWLMKFGAVNRIKGNEFVDYNGNGIKDINDQSYSAARIESAIGSKSYVVKPFEGNFENRVDTGTYITTLTPDWPYFTVSPVSHTSTFPTLNNVDSFSFALHPTMPVTDLLINVIGLGPARPGFNLGYEIDSRNVGVVAIPAGQIVFVKDPRLQVLSTIPVPDVTVGDTLKWNYTNFEPTDVQKIILNLRVLSPVTHVGDTLSSIAFITPVAGDISPGDDTSIIRQFVTGGVDPNDKAENLGGSITKQQVESGDYINYFIRFQNTGTDTAFNVVVRDTLDNKLDWNSFQMISSSHPYTLQIDDQNKLVWTFYGINLPDSNVNEPASHGYIAYRIKADNSLNIGATFLNRASIYFDFNLPVHTNFAPMIVGTPITLPLMLLDFDAKYQQPNTEVKWTTTDESNVDRFIIERGEDPFHFVPVGIVGAKGNNAGGETHYQFFDKLANVNGDKFYYRLRMVDRDNKFTYSNIALVKRNGTVNNEVAVIPNPTRTGVIIANINYNKNAPAILSITDVQGKVLSTSKLYLNKGYNVVPLPGIALPNGTYFLEVKSEGKQMVTRFVISQ